MPARPLRSAVCLVVASLLVLGACGGNDSSSSAQPETTDGTSAQEPVGEPQSGGTLRYALNSETNTWDPSAAQYSLSGWTVALTVFDTLMAIDESGEPKPYLAESFEPNEDYTVWTITPRSGVTFHNGEELTAELVKTNIERYAIAPLTATLFDETQSIEVSGDSVVVTLNEPWVQFPLIFTDRPGMMVAQEMIDDPEGGSAPIGTGPFAFGEWIVDDHLTVNANAEYWNGTVYLDSIDFRIIVEENSRLAAFEAGEFDVAPFIDTGSVTDLTEQADAGEVKIYHNEGEGEELLYLINTSRAPFDDIRVREALVLAHDRGAGIDAVGEGLYEPADGIWAPDSPWYVDTTFPEADQARAAELVEEWESENGPLRIEVSATQDPITIRNMQFIQSEWEDVGIEVEIVPGEQADYINRVLLGDYDLALWQFYSAAHPDGEYAYLHSDFSPDEGIASNFGRFRDPVIDAALDEARGVDDPERQNELYGEVQQAMTDGFYAVWLYHDVNVLAAADTVEDLTVWEFPDATPGLSLQNLRTKLTGVWLSEG